MSAELCDFGPLAIRCLLDASWIQASAWITTTIPTRHASPKSDANLVAGETFADNVVSAADQLPLDQARALWLVDVCELTYAEGAAETCTTPERFAAMLHAARRTIQEGLS